MANLIRRPGKKGMLSRRPDRVVPFFENYLRTAAPGQRLTAIPLTKDVDRSSQVAQIPMYLNDKLGDCTIAGGGHFLGAQAVYAGYPEPLFSDQVITTAYSAVSGYVPPPSSDPGGPGENDNGAACADVLEHLRTVGMLDTTGKLHKLAGWAAIRDVTDEALLGTALSVFGTVYLGINCPESAEDQFGQGRPWTVVPGSPDAGGHCVVMQRRYPVGSSTGVDEWWTWGARQRVTFPFVSQYLREAYVPVSQDWIRACGTTPDGINLTQLLADMSMVG